MSCFIAAALPQNILMDTDERINRQDFMPLRMFADTWALAVASFETDWWPRGGNLLGDSAPAIEAAWWGEFDQAAGAGSRFGFVGVTRDVNGSPVGSCSVKLYRTSNDILLDAIISDPNGNFLLNTAYYPDAHYIVAHKTGSPDIDGVTPNNLIAT